MIVLMQTEEIKRLIEAGLADSEAYVEGDGAHFTAFVKAASFSGKSRIERQQMVYETVKQELLNGMLHALSIKTFTLEEWEKLEKSK
jgi:acid stress-induced BolA-like protein IbaG/YrbA